MLIYFDLRASLKETDMDLLFSQIAPILYFLLIIIIIIDRIRIRFAGCRIRCGLIFCSVLGSGRVDSIFFSVLC